MLKIYLFFVVLRVAALQEADQGGHLGLDLSGRKGTAKECNVFDSDDVQRFNPLKCSSIRITGIFPDLDGNLMFKGLTRNKTIEFVGNNCYIPYIGNNDVLHDPEFLMQIGRNDEAYNRRLWEKFIKTPIRLQNLALQISKFLSDLPKCMPKVSYCMEPRALLNLRISHSSGYRVDSNGFVFDGDHGLIYLPNEPKNFVPKPLNQPKSSEHVEDQTAMAGITLERLLSQEESKFCDSGPHAGSLTLSSYEILKSGCNRCSYVETNRTAYYSNRETKIFYRDQSVPNLIDVDKCDIIEPPTPKPPVTRPTEPTSHFNCLQGLCGVPAKEFYKSASPVEYSNNCRKLLSMIVGFKTALDVCERA